MPFFMKREKSIRSPRDLPPPLFGLLPPNLGRELLNLPPPKLGFALYEEVRAPKGALLLDVYIILGHSQYM